MHLLRYPYSGILNFDSQYELLFVALVSGNAGLYAYTSAVSEFDTVSVIERDSNDEHKLAEDSEGNTIEISVGIKPFVVTVSPDGQYVYVANQWDNISEKKDTISVIRVSGNEVIDTFTVGNYPKAILPTDESTLYVSNNKDDTVSFK